MKKKVKEVCHQLPKLVQNILEIFGVSSTPTADLQSVLGLSSRLCKRWFKEGKYPKSMVEFNRLEGSGGVIPATTGDLFLHIKGSRVDLCFELANRFVNALPKESIEKLDETSAFLYMRDTVKDLGRDLTGFLDGTGNPKPDKRVAETLISTEDPEHEGGSYAISMKWKHNLKYWETLTEREQELVIGRTKKDSIKIREGRPENSHLSRMEVVENGQELKILRQSLTWGDTQEQGLFFIAYANLIHKYDRMLQRMVGLEGPSDQLMKVSAPESCNYWYIPSLVEWDSLFT